MVVFLGGLRVPLLEIQVEGGDREEDIAWNDLQPFFGFHLVYFPSSFYFKYIYFKYSRWTPELKKKNGVCIESSCKLLCSKYFGLMFSKFTLFCCLTYYPQIKKHLIDIFSLSI